MGAPPIQIKRTIDFNKGFKSLLEVLKLVAVSEYYSLERKLKSFDRLESLLSEFFDSIDLSQVNHPFVSGVGPMGVVAITSDGGLLGGINNQVVTKAVELVRENGGKLYVIGERGTLYAQDSGLPYESFPGVQDAKRWSQACQLRDFLVQRVLAGELGGLKVVYPRAASFVVHRVEVTTLLPFEVPEKKAAGEMIIESDTKDIVEYLVYLVIGQRLYDIFGISRVCEQAARYLHLEESCNKIGEMNKKLLLQYFKRRHEVIDANMRELFSARGIVK